MEAIRLLENWCRDKGYKVVRDEDLKDHVTVTVRGRGFYIYGKDATKITILDMSKGAVNLSLDVTMAMEELLADGATFGSFRFDGSYLSGFKPNEFDLAEPDSFQKILALFAKP